MTAVSSDAAAIEVRWTTDDSGRLLLVTNDPQQPVGFFEPPHGTALSLLASAQAQPQRLLSMPGTIRAPQLSPDGQLLSFVHTHALVEVNPFTGIFPQIEDWSLRIRLLDDPQRDLHAIGSVSQASVEGVVAYAWIAERLLVLSVQIEGCFLAQSQCPPGTAAKARSSRLILQQLRCRVGDCSEPRETLAEWSLPPAAGGFFYLGLLGFLQLPPEAFFALSPDGRRAIITVVDRFSLEGEGDLAVSLYEVDLVTRQSRLRKAGGIFPAFAPDGKLAYLAPFGLVAVTERVPRDDRLCIEAGSPSEEGGAASGFICVESKTRVYLQDEQGTEQSLTSALHLNNLLFGQLFWLSAQELGYVELVFRSDSEGNSVLEEIRLKVVDVETRHVKDLTQSLLRTFFPAGPFAADCSVGVRPFERDLQATIDRLPEGGVLCLGPGPGRGNLTIRKNLTLRGAGPGHTWLEGQRPGLPVLHIAGKAQVHLEDFTIRNAQECASGSAICRPYGLLVQEQAELFVTNLEISGNASAGLRAEDSAVVSVEGTVIAEHEYDGVSAEGSARLSLVNSKLVHNRFDGLEASGSAMVSITDSQLSENGFNGLQMRESAQVTLMNSQVSGNGFRGVVASGSARVSLTGSQVMDSDDGLVVSESAIVSLATSQVSGNDTGLSIRDMARADLTDSVIADNEENGLVIEGTAQATLSKAQVSSNRGSGFLVEDSATVEVQDSSFLENKECGIFVGSEEARVQGTSQEFQGNGADLCGFAPAALRKPLVSPTERTQISFPGDYAHLQEAVDALAPGGTITLAAGRYELAGLVLWKPVTLHGAGPQQTILRVAPDRSILLTFAW